MSAMIKLFLGPLKKWAYSDFMQETAKPTRRAWVRIRKAHMESLIKGIMEVKGSFHTILHTFRRKHCYHTIQA